MKEIKIQIIDDFLDEEDFNIIINYVENDLEWKVEDYNNLSVYLTRKIYKDSIPLFDFYEKLIPLLDKLRVIGLIEIDLNLYLKSNHMMSKEIKKDNNFNHGIAIYYLNDNNGYTLLNNGTKIKNKKNRLLIFESDEDQTYFESTCTDSKYKLNLTIKYL